MSRLPRHLEHLKTGFTAEAVSAAMFRAFAEQAAGEDKPNLARFWRELAERKDRLAIAQLGASGRIKDEDANLKTAIAEEQYEIEVLYPRLVADLRGFSHADEATLLEAVTAEQRRHAEALDRLRKEMKGATEDVGEPSIPESGL